MYQLSNTWLETLKAKQVKRQEIFQTNYVLQKEVTHDEEAKEDRGVISAVFSAGFANPLITTAI